MTKEDLAVILSKHAKWLRDEDGGERANLRDANLRYADLRDADLQDADLRDADLQDADLRDADLRDADLQRADLRDANLRGANLQRANLQYADLQDADLRGADLRDANLDFSCLPLWCGGSKFKADARLAAQIAAHFCAIDCDDPAYIAARTAILPFALTSHRAADLGLKE